MVTLTATDSASLQPVLDPDRSRVLDPSYERAALGLIADPLGLRRVELLLGDAFDVVARAQDVEELLARMAVAIDVALLSGGLELCSRGGAIAQLASLSARPAIVVMAKTDERSFVHRALRAGAHGFVCERAAETALVPTIEAALAGQLSVPPTVRGRIAWRALSLREQQVLALVAEGMTNGEIAYRLCLSESTVKTHLSSSFRKLSVASRAEAAALVLDPDHGLHAGVPSRTLLAVEDQLFARAPG